MIRPRPPRPVGEAKYLCTPGSRTCVVKSTGCDESSLYTYDGPPYTLMDKIGWCIWSCMACTYPPIGRSRHDASYHCHAHRQPQHKSWGPEERSVRRRKLVVFWKQVAHTAPEDHKGPPEWSDTNVSGSMFYGQGAEGFELPADRPDNLNYHEKKLSPECVACVSLTRMLPFSARARPSGSMSALLIGKLKNDISMLSAVSCECPSLERGRVELVCFTHDTHHTPSENRAGAVCN